MRVLIAPDKFKGTLSADLAASAIERGVRAAFQSAAPEIKLEIVIRPLADGGEGSHECLTALLPMLPALRNVNANTRDLPDACGREHAVPCITAESASAGAGTRHCYLETALAIGLLLPGAREKSILERETTGVGRWIAQMITSATEESASPQPATLVLHLFLGGSATSDGGFGLARALGFCFYTADPAAKASAREIIDFAELESATHVTPPAPSGIPVQIWVYTDVQNPLDGPDGAARLFGPQKGATPAEVQTLEARLQKLGRLFEDCLRPQLQHAKERHGLSQGNTIRPLFRAPGAGAAGGLALPLLYWPEALVRFRPGIDYFLDAAGIRPPASFDLIVTGEGCTDRGSLQGKVVAGLLGAFHNQNTTMLVTSGMIPAEDRAALCAAGFRDEHLHDTNRICGEAWPVTPDEAATRLTQTAEHAVRALLAEGADSAHR